MIARRQMLAGMAALAAVPGMARAVGPAPARGPGQARWETGAALPVPVQEIYPALWRGQLVVAGGFAVDAGALVPTAAVWAKAPAGQRWTALPRLPEALHHPLLVTDGRRLMAVGGFHGAGLRDWAMRADSWVLAPFDTAWRRGPSLPHPQAEVAGGLLPGDVVMVAGGRMPREGSANASYGDHRDTGAAWVLKPGARNWEAVTAMPTPRNSSAAAVLEGRLHVVGGRTSGEGIVNLAVHEAYDPRADRWEVRASLPAPRGGHAAAVLGGRLYCFGGEAFQPAPTVFGEVFAYDPQADRWETVASMPEPRHGLGAVTAGGAIHLLGGAAEAGGRATRASHDMFRV